MLRVLTMLNWFLVSDQTLARPQACSADKHANGCSVPLGINAPYKADFTPACNKHDICYGCVSTFFMSNKNMCYQRCLSRDGRVLEKLIRNIPRQGPFERVSFLQASLDRIQVYSLHFLLKNQ